MKEKEANICFDLLVHRAVDLQMRSLQWNGYASPCMMTHLFGHVGSLDVEFHKTGWKSGKEPTLSIVCYENDKKQYSLMRDTLNYIEEELDKWEAERNESRVC